MTSIWARAVGPTLAAGVAVVGAAAPVIGGCAHAPSSPQSPAKADTHIHVAPGVTAKSLGRVAIPTFEIEGHVREEPTLEHADTDWSTSDRVVRRRHADTMDVTRAFTGRLVSTDLVLLDRQFVDERLKELEGGASLRVSDETAPSFGRELGAQTLVVGQYRFECSGELSPSDGGEFVRPQTVHRQSLQVRGFELETGRVIFDVEVALDEDNSRGRLLPRSLARTAAKKLWAQLSATE